MEYLPDPYNDRPMKDITPFVNKELTDEMLFSTNKGGHKVPKWTLLQEFMVKEGPLRKDQIIKILKLGIDILKKEPNLVKIQEPVVVVGDIHGQYYDLVEMMNKAGDPSLLNYLFLGDYVDRGIFGIECVILLTAIKINYP